MNREQPWITFAAFAALSLSGLGQAAKPSASTSPHRAAGRSETSQPTGEPLSTGTLSSVDPHYLGMNVDAIYSALHKGIGVAKQSEYETKSEFAARLEKIKALPLVGRHAIGDQYTFVVGGAWEGEGSVSKDNAQDLSVLRGAIETNYNAESEMLTVKIPKIQGLASGRDHISFGWSYDSHVTGKHIGENAFGVKKVIVDGISLQYTLEVDTADLGWLSAYCSQEYDVECSVRIPAAKARAMDGDVRVAIGATLMAPYADEETGVDSATIDSPYETRQTERGIYIVPNQLVMYSRRSGEILAQFSTVAFQQEYPLHVEITENGSPDWSSPICTPAFTIRDAPISFEYQVDNDEVKHVFDPKLPLSLQAKSSVNLSIPYCSIPRLRVLRNGSPYKLTCEEQNRYALNVSKCEAIGLNGSIH